MSIHMDDETIILTFGHGDIGVTTYDDPGNSHAGIEFALRDAGQVGQWMTAEEVEAQEPLVSMHFTSVESLDVVMGMLATVRGYLAGSPAVADAPPPTTDPWETA